MSFYTDSLYITKLQEIKDTLVHVAQNTTPATSLGEYQSTFDGKIALFSLVAGVLACIFSFLGWLAQRQSTRQLKQRNKKRPSLYPLVRKVYDDGILLNVIFEYDSNYDMSYSAEQRVKDENKSSNKKRLMYKLYPTNKLVYKMLLPEDIIILDKFEIYNNDEIYNLAYSLRGNIHRYNQHIIRVQKNLSSSGKESVILSEVDSLKSTGRTIIKQLFAMDEMIRREESPVLSLFSNKGSKSMLEEELSFYIISRFFNSVKYLTPEYILEDLYIIYPISNVEFSQIITFSQLLKKKRNIDLVIGKSCLPSPDYLHIRSNLISCIKCIEYIKYRKGRNKTNKGRISLLANKIFSKNTPQYNDEPLKKIIEKCLGDIYQELIYQIDNDNFDINKISQYDTRMQVGTLKHNLLLNSSKQVYENERRRIKRKAIWFKGKEKYNEKVCEM